MKPKGPVPMRRLPWEPLRRLVADMTLNDIACRCRMTPNAVHCAVYGHGGTLTLAMADRFAVGLGFHPAEVWGDAWWEVADG